jgi:hypothetical protein
MKITAITSERIREHVMNASIWRLTLEETSEYLRLSGLPSNPKTVQRYKRKIRESANQWIATLAKGKRGEYIAEYKKRADTLEACERELWLIVNNKGTHARTRVEAIARIMDCSARLSDLYDRLPVVAAIRDYEQTTAVQGVSNQ